MILPLQVNPTYGYSHLQLGTPFLSEQTPLLPQGLGLQGSGTNV